jgi:CRP-like cAMP-binding protein
VIKIDQEVSMSEMTGPVAEDSPMLPSERLLNAKYFPVLAGMAPLLLRILNQSASLLYVSDNVEILQQGDIPQDLYFIEEGMVAIARETDEGRKELLRLGKGDVFGELGALRGRSRLATVSTLVLSRIIRVHADAVRQLMEVDREFAGRLQTLMKQRLIGTFLASHPVFAGMPEQVSAVLVNSLQLEVLPKEKMLFAAGATLQGVYMILSGEVEVRVALGRDEDVVLEMRRDNETLGELRDGSTGEVAYSAIASCDTDVLHFNDSVLQILRTRCPDIAERLDDFIAGRARATQEKIDQHRL